MDLDAHHFVFICVISGIQRDKTMADKLMYTPNDNKKNYPFCRLQCLKRLNTQLNEPTNQKSI